MNNKKRDKEKMTKFEKNLESIRDCGQSLIVSENTAAQARKSLRAAMSALFKRTHLSDAKASAFVSVIKPLFQSIIDTLKDGEAVADAPAWDALRNAISKHKSFKALYALSIKTTGGSLSVVLKKKEAEKEASASKTEAEASASKTEAEADESLKLSSFEDSLKANFEKFMTSQIDTAEKLYKLSESDAQQVAFDTITDLLMKYAISQ